MQYVQKSLFDYSLRAAIIEESTEEVPKPRGKAQQRQSQLPGAKEIL